jgi:hypothetical protein
VSFSAFGHKIKYSLALRFLSVKSLFKASEHICWRVKRFYAFSSQTLMFCQYPSTCFKFYKCYRNIWLSICDSDVSTALISIAVSASTSRYNIMWTLQKVQLSSLPLQFVCWVLITRRIPDKLSLLLHSLHMKSINQSYEVNRSKILHAAEHTQQTWSCLRQKWTSMFY